MLQLTLPASRYILSPMNSNGYTAWLEIDLDTIRQNVHELRRISKTDVMAVVKANGYGHGAVEIAKAALAGGASWLGVARLEEALALRQAGLGCPIQVLGFTSPSQVKDAIHFEIRLSVYDTVVGKAYADIASKANKKLHLHIKVDTGMSRLGVSPDKTIELIQLLKPYSQINIEGIFTHFARADEPQSGTTTEQIEKFDHMLTGVRQAGHSLRYIHAANSAAILNYPQARYDMVRPGIALYGCHPSTQTPLPAGIKPAVTWKTRLTSVNLFPPGRGISYGHIYTTRSSERIGAIAIGYADGFRRITNNFALVHGKRVPVVGRVCMDQCMLQLDTIPDAAIGDEVVLLGSQGSETITAEEIADRWGTINYEVICGLAARIPRLYYGEQ